MSSYKYIIWDWNGTLIDDVEICVEILNVLLDRYKLGSVSQEEYERKFCFPVKSYYEGLGFDFTQIPYETIAQKYIKEYEQKRVNCNLQKGAKSILAELSRKGLEQSILSASEQKSLERIVEHFGISNYFTHLYGLGNHCADGKVGRGRELIENINCSKEEILLIGDTDHDLEVSQELGIECLLFYSGHQSIEKLNSCEAKITMTLTELSECRNLFA